MEIGDAGLDLLLRARLFPVTVLGKGTDEPLLRADRVVVRPRLAALLGGRVDPAAVALRGVRIWPGRTGDELGPFDLFVELRSGGAVAARIGLAGGGHLDASGQRGPEGITFRAEGAISFPDDLPPTVAASLPLTPGSGRLALRADGSSTPGGDRIEVVIDLRATELTFDGPRVGPVPLGPVALGASGRVRWTGATRRLELTEGVVTLGTSGEVSAAVKGEVVAMGDPRFSMSARAEAVPWQSLVDALPPDLGPPPTAPRLSGNLSARASASGTLSRRGEWDVQVDLDLEDLRRAARAGGPSWLSSGFAWTPIDPGPGEAPRRIAVGPGNPDYVPYPEVPQFLVRAVTASEDAGFFGHRGFDFREIANAVADPGRVRGASTISQQLSKNLFLTPGADPGAEGARGARDHRPRGEPLEGPPPRDLPEHRRVGSRGLRRGRGGPLLVRKGRERSHRPGSGLPGHRHPEPAPVPRAAACVPASRPGGTPASTTSSPRCASRTS